MSDYTTPSRAGMTGDGVPSSEQGPHLTLSPTGPQRPEAGSALERLLRRQTITTGATLLGFVPAQVR
ncbi:hypothetical protein [uncultured Cellulomonas sp.]|uniref:hypothetical protein n=1 Tax=uncultured Cellulomonas sp. TaxID=189682 RepID=UPI002634771D|nr:hypothetical protein [uncultured Cellulomonas sp.]